jgi:hypothetical protein
MPQQVKRGRFIGANYQPPGRMVAKLRDRILQLKFEILEAACVLEYCPAGIGQYHVAGGTVQKLFPKLGFKALKRKRNSGLRTSELVGRARKTPLGRNGHENPKRAQFHWLIIAASDTGKNAPAARLKFLPAHADTLVMVVSLRELLDPCRVSDEEALEIARQRAAQRDSFGLEMARQVDVFLKSPGVAGGMIGGLIERGFLLVEATARPVEYLWLVRAGLLHDDSSVRFAAISLLGRQAKNPGWIQKLASDTEERVRCGLMDALCRHPDPETEQVLLAGASDLSPEVAAAAVHSLYRIDPQRHAEAVHKLISHRIPAFRCAAAGLIGKLDPARRAQFLKPLLTDSDASVRRAAFQTLSAIKGANAA